MRLLSVVLVLVANAAHAETVRFKDEPYTKIVSTLQLDLPSAERWKASGYYTRDDAGTLDGTFDVKHHVQGHSDEIDTDYEFLSRARGSFAKGIKTKTWTYDYVLNDGIDIFEQHTITITYKNGECTGSTFDGRIGHIMPTTKHSFTNRELCSPKAIRLKASELWGAEYERRKQRGEL